MAAAVVAGACYEPDTDDDYVDADTAMIAEEQTDAAYAEWDADANRYLDDSEFAAWWRDRGDRFDWDLDDEQGLNRDEYSEGVFVLWDTNGDDVVDEAEWRSGTTGIYGEGRYERAFVDWDGDGDSELDLNEVREGLETDGLYDHVDGDRDALIDDEELADWFFDIFDADDDSRIDTTEWESTWLEGR
jgi:hypothetical protein